jgi:phospholipid/cholesterol/gamma-HCH transport system substrate-binding protein
MSRGALFETVVGALVLVVAGAFLFYAYRASGAESERGGYRLNAVFGRVDGVTPGAEVRIAGVKVGAVSQTMVDPATYEARVSFTLARDVKVPEDSIAKVVSDGLIGGAHVAIEPGASETMIEDGGTIAITQGSVDLLSLAVEAFTSNAGAKDDENSGGLEP